MLTLTGTASPAGDNKLPVVMIVGGTADSRRLWRESCRQAGLDHHFVEPRGATRRINEDFPVAGLILDYTGEPPTHSKDMTILLSAIEASYRGPLVVTGLPTENDSRHHVLEQLIQRIVAEARGPFRFLVGLNDQWWELFWINTQ